VFVALSKQTTDTDAQEFMRTSSQSSRPVTEFRPLTGTSRPGTRQSRPGTRQSGIKMIETELACKSWACKETEEDIFHCRCNATVWV
jgi:hypothetical protein